jgi:1-acyl-sn-glycerol-3-phosphate acyltransferase
MARTLTSLLFYTRLFSIVVRGSAQAKRGLYGTPEWCEGSLATLRALEAAGVKFEITGIDAFTAVEGPCIFIANHMSTLETFVLPTIIASFKDATFVVKQSLVDYPIFKHIMRARDPITVGRTNPRDDLRAVLEGGTERLKAGRSIVIFPQTTRTPVFDPAQFNTIGIKLAKRAGVPVVPIALTTSAWGNGTYVKDYGRIDPSKKVHFAFGKPLWIRDRGTEEHQEIIEFITEKLTGWEAEEKAGNV